jgi:hypothetical protein
MKFKPSRLTLAIATTLAGGALSFNAAASTTMYNTFTTTNPSATDGWVYGFCTTCANGARAIAYNSANPQAYTAGGVSGGGFYGTDATSPTAYSALLPFNYTGTSSLNWAAHLTSAGDTAQISQADSIQRYGYAAEIDTGGGAWQDDGSTTNGISTGWKHQTDIGLIESDVTQNITLNLTNLDATYARFGITVFQGMDTKTTAYVHHGAWNNAAMPVNGNVPAQAGHAYDMNNPFGTVGLTNIGYSDNVDSTAANSFTFTAQAGQVYSIYLGGYQFGGWHANVANYQLDIATSPVPVPGAVWLFGSALAGLGVTGRRKKAIS